MEACLSPEDKSARPLLRVGATIGLRPEALEEYRRLHVKLWPEIEAAIKAAGLRNYSIFFNDGQLFAYFEHPGPQAELDAAMKRLASAPRMREWWAITERMQIARPDRKPGEWWTTMEEVFHLD
jgi:L-rhamnose mutarotase